MAAPDWGLVAKALAAGLAIKGAKGKFKAGQINDYVNAVNSGLPQDYQVNVPQKNFFFGDAKAYQGAIDNIAKQKNEQYASDYYADRAGLQRGPLGAIKDIYNSEIAPERLERSKRDIQGEYGRKELQGLPQAMEYIDSLSGDGPGVLPISAPKQIGKSGPQMEADPSFMYTGGPMEAGAQYSESPSLPDYISPETLRSAMGFYNTQRGQNVTQRGQDVTMRGQDFVRQTAQERIAEQKRMNEARIKNMTDKLGIDRQRLALYAKAIQQRTGRAPTKVEIAQSMLRNGEITRDEFKNFIIKAPDINVLGGLLGSDVGGASSGGGIPSFAEYDSGE